MVHHDFIQALQHTLPLSIQETICQVTAQANAYHHPYLPSTINVWNSLPEAVIQTSSVEKLRLL